MARVPERLSQLEQARDGQLALNERFAAQLDKLQYHVALLLRDNAKIEAQLRGRVGAAAVKDDIVLGMLNKDQDWVWIQGASSIAEGAFKDTNVANVVIADSIPKLTIGGSAFRQCPKLKTFDIPGSVTEVLADAFRDSALSTLTFGRPSSLRAIGDHAFEGVKCESVDLPSSLAMIGKYAFCYCKRLRSVLFDEGSKLCLLGKRAFSDCPVLRTVAIPAALLEVPPGCFESCRELDSVRFAGNSLGRIGAGAFHDCVRLRSIHVPPSVSVIGAASRIDSTDSARSHDMDRLGSFAGCASLVEVTFGEGSSLVLLGERCFSGCESLRRVGPAPALKTIAPSAFSGCRRLVEVPLPAVVKRIGEFALAGCEGLTQLRFAGCLDAIGPRAFQGCTSLQKVEFGSSRLRYLGDEAFSGCDQLLQLSLPRVKAMGRAVAPSTCKVEVRD